MEGERDQMGVLKPFETAAMGHWMQWVKHAKNRSQDLSRVVGHYAYNSDFQVNHQGLCGTQHTAPCRGALGVTSL